MRIEIIVKHIGDTYEDFECKVNKTIRFLENEYDKKILDVNILYDGKNLIAVIKYI